jgi:uncharacterized protein YjbJ (UPF0337 family)
VDSSLWSSIEREIQTKLYSTNSSQTHINKKDIMSTENRVKSVVKNVEGKGQEALGNLTGNAEDKVTGQAKQGEAAVQSKVEDAKDKIGEVKDDLVDKAKNVAEKVHDGLENAKDSIVDTAKKVSDKVHDGIEDVKAKAKK